MAEHLPETTDQELVRSAGRGVPVPPGLEWLREQVSASLAVLHTLKLEGTPAAGTIRGVMAGWMAALLANGREWHQARDVPRLQEAFRRLAAQNHFPRPKWLLIELERIEQEERAGPPLTEAEQEARLARMRERERASLREREQLVRWLEKSRRPPEPRPADPEQFSAGLRKCLGAMGVTLERSA